MRELRVCQEAKSLIGFWINVGSPVPKNIVSTWSKEHAHNSDTVCSTWGEAIKRRIARQLQFIRHWKVTCKPYDEIITLGQRATWFVDPPYVERGASYKMGSKNLNYDALGEWCQSRRGQVMVCENDGADWLHFVPFAEMSGQAKPSKEVIWLGGK